MKYYEKRIVISFILFAISSIAISQSLIENAQKPALDTGIIHKWPMGDWAAYISRARPSLTNDAAFIYYSILHQPTGFNTLVLQSLDGGWKRTFVGKNKFECAVTNDSKKAIFLLNDTLFSVLLGTSKVEYFFSVTSYQLINHGKEQWLIYQRTNRTLVFRHLASKSSMEFAEALSYLIGADGQRVVARYRKNEGEAINITNLRSGSSSEIWEGKSATNLVLDRTGKRLAFSVLNGNNQEEHTYFYYDGSKPTAVAIATSKSISDNYDSLILGDINLFSSVNNKLIVTLWHPAKIKSSDAVMVDVWSYLDPRLKSDESDELPSYIGVCDISNGNIIRLTFDNEKAIFDNSYENLVIEKHSGGVNVFNNEKNWNSTAVKQYYFASLYNNERKEIKDFHSPYFRTFSPTGKYAFSYDSNFADILCIETATGLSRNITMAMNIPEGDLGDDTPESLALKGLEIIGWGKDDQKVFIKDKYDLWVVDLLNHQTPVNITQGLGRSHHIYFSTITGGEQAVVKDKGFVTLYAFDSATKQSGFYKADLTGKETPVQLKMEPALYKVLSSMENKKGLQLVARESATESSNIFYTSDFKQFQRISNICPEKKYNWLTTSLLEFTALDGRKEQAILYKPEDFNPDKKYPVIINYYEQKSQELNYYMPPALNNGRLDIPWFVSHGYLVLVPDIHYTIGTPGKNCYNSVVAAAKMLKTYPFVDVEHVGIQGHSWGGFQTNYLITHTNQFAAAISSSGLSDFVSGYGSLDGTNGKGISHQAFYELTQCRIGATLWERPDLYIINSPVFDLDKVSTPVLTIANKRDGRANFEGGVELFTGLRRLGKKSWMLQYDKGGHGLGGKEYIDYIIRSTQFFDHYLKSAPAPVWMTRGVSTIDKGVKTGYEIDTEIKTPGEGLLAPEEKAKIDQYSKKTLSDKLKLINNDK